MKENFTLKCIYFASYFIMRIAWSLSIIIDCLHMLRRKDFWIKGTMHSNEEVVLNNSFQEGCLLRCSRVEKRLLFHATIIWHQKLAPPCCTQAVFGMSIKMELRKKRLLSVTVERTFFDCLERREGGGKMVHFERFNGLFLFCGC